MQICHSDIRSGMAGVYPEIAEPLLLDLLIMSFYSITVNFMTSGILKIQKISVKHPKIWQASLESETGQLIQWAATSSQFQKIILPSNNQMLKLVLQLNNLSTNKTYSLQLISVKSELQILKFMKLMRCTVVSENQYQNKLQMLKQQCVHFPTFKIPKSLFIPTHPQCKNCQANRNNLWLCLYKDCQQFYCGRGQFQHSVSHYQQSRRKKTYHSLFMNVLTAQIYCVSCKLFVDDQEDQNMPQDISQKVEESVVKINSAYRLRVKVLPFLSELGSFRFDGQIQYPEAHRKINSGSVGIISHKYNHTIHSALQFIAHCSYFREIILAMVAPQTNQLLRELQKTVQQIDLAKYRVITADLVYSELPHLLTYRRKDPFEVVLFLLGKIHELLRYRSLADKFIDQDEWELFYERGKTKVSCPIYDSIEIQLRMNYICPKCKKHEYSIQNINYLKLTLPKKKRSNKEVEKELNQYRGQSPLKQRKKSLASFFFKQPEMPITIHEMMIDLMKKPLHKQRHCSECSQVMKKSKIQIQKLPGYLIIQINRMDDQGYAIDDTKVEFSHDSIDFGAFTVQKEKEAFYSFECAVGLEQGGLYPVMARNPNNKQLQLLRNQNIEHSHQMNPYILCYKRLASSQKKVKQIQSQNQKEGYIIPDFWMIYLKHGFERQLINPFVCKHNCLKPSISALECNKMTVSRQTYQGWAELYHGKPYESYICFECEQNKQRVQQRRKLQKQAIKQYDSIKSQFYCMLSIEWVNRWSKFVYSRDSPNYSSKGWPLPGKIDNKTIMDGKQCKPYLVLNKDFKLVNVYVWKFLRQTYGGGPQIRYKWKKQHPSMLDEQLMREIKEKGAMMRHMLKQFTVEVLSKKGSTMEQSSYMPQQQHSNIQA